MDRIVMFKPYVNEKAIENVGQVLRSGWIGEGPKVKEFEAALKARFGFEHVLALNSGTSGLRLALALCGVGPGDEVITTAQTCTATNTPILEQFAVPVFADIQYRTGNINPLDIEHRITEKTKAIMCVHWAGYPCDMDELQFVADRHRLPLIQDGAHALGASYHGLPIGVTSDFFMCSFQAIKQLTTGDGGMLAMMSEEHYHEGRRRRWFGIDRENRETRLDGYSYWNQTEPGYKYQMNDVAAAIGLGNLEDINRLLARRAQIVEFYRYHLVNVPGVTLFEQREDRKSANWLFTMHVERRDDFCRMMRSKGIDVSVVHIRNDEHGVFKSETCCPFANLPFKRPDLPVLDKYAQTQISIPLHNHLSDEQILRAVNTIEGGW